jgi:hypothetical protein
MEKTIPFPGKKIPKKKPVTSREITIKFPLKKVIVSAFCLIILLVIAGYFLFRSKGKDFNLIPGTTIRITYELGLEIDPSLSPDGKMVAFASGLPGQARILVRQVSGGRTLDITRNFTGNQRWPQWSPDGT